MSDFWSFLYGRLAAVTKPIFTQRELEQFDQSVWQPLIDNGTLLRAAEPETLIVQNGREVVVRKSRGKVYGVDFSGLCARTVDLEPEDLLRYALSLPNLVQKLRAKNKIYGKGTSTWGGGLLLGTSRGPQRGSMLAKVIFYTEFDSEKLKAQLTYIRELKSPTVAVFPLMPEIDDLYELESNSLHIADLSGDFLINWPESALPYEETKPFYAMHEEGQTWRFICEGAERTIKASKGAEYIAFLVANPGCVMSPFDLQARRLPDHESRFDLSDAIATFGEYASDADRQFSVVDNPDGERLVLDDVAVRKYRTRLKQIEEEIEDAITSGRGMEADELEDERNTLLAQLMGSVSQNRGKTSAELNRARDAVSKAIRRAIEEVGSVLPKGKDHLEKYISTGNSFVYAKDPMSSWDVKFL